MKKNNFFLSFKKFSLRHFCFKNKVSLRRNSFFEISSFFLSSYFTFFISAGFFIFSGFLTSCSSSDHYDLNTASGNFQHAQKLEKKYGDFEMAIIYYKNVKNKFPYDPLATEAELRIADLLFEQGQFIESEGAYKVFKEFHPKHKKLDHVTYQLGMSLFKQASRSIDRDLSGLQKALPVFNEVLDSFKESSYFEKALKKKQECIDRLARKELYIAKFYLNQKSYNSALRRYEKIIKKYPKHEKNSITLYGAMLSAYSMNQDKKFKKYYAHLIENYPNSKEAKKAKRKFSIIMK